MITVYTKTGCPACVGTCRYLERHGLDYRIVDIDVNWEARNYIAKLGFTDPPVVETGTEAWSGLKIDKLAALKPTEPNDTPVTVDP